MPRWSALIGRPARRPGRGLGGDRGDRGPSGHHLPAVPDGDDRPGALALVADRRAGPVALDGRRDRRDDPGVRCWSPASGATGRWSSPCWRSWPGRPASGFGRRAAYSGPVVLAAGLWLPGPARHRRRALAAARRDRRRGPRPVGCGDAMVPAWTTGRALRLSAVAWAVPALALIATVSCPMTGPDWIRSARDGPDGPLPVRRDADATTSSGWPSGAGDTPPESPGSSARRARRRSGSGRGGRWRSTGPPAPTTPPAWPTGPPGSPITSASGARPPPSPAPTSPIATPWNAATSR